MASPSTGAKSFLVMALEQQIANSQVGGPYTVLPAANWGLLQYPIMPGTIFAREDEWVTPEELTGNAGAPAALPGRIMRPLDLPMSLRTSGLIPIMATCLGNPTKAQDGANSAWSYTYTAKDGTGDAVSMWGLFHKGGATTPLAFARARFNELAFETSGQEMTLNAKGMACLDTEHGIGVVGGSNTGTYTAHLPVIMGDRMDANRVTDTLYVKVSAAPSTGTFKLKVKLGGGSYSTVESTVYYDTSSKNQTAWAELFTDSGALGADECEHRGQVLIFFPGDVTGLALNDEFSFPAVCQIPGTAAQGGDTTVARTQISGCRFGPAHITLKKGTSSADTAVDFESGAFTLSREITPAFTHGAGARNPYDMDVTGYVNFGLEIDRRFDSRTYERLMRTNDRYVMQVLLEAQVIGGGSTWRETVQMDFPQVRVDKSASPLSGPGITKEKVSFVVEQDAAGSAPVTVVIKSGTNFDFSIL